jgi:uncharacterized protein (TIGR00299 family) protein
MRTLFLDPVGGLAGDMITAALIDLGAPLSAIQTAIAALPVDGIEVHTEACMRGPFAATQFFVAAQGEAHHHRSWLDIRAMLEAAPLAPGVAERAIKVFQALAQAEAEVHGTTVEQVHFHEVGAWDSIADIVGASAALTALDVGQLVCGPPPLGSGSIQTAHGAMPLPAPATLSLLAGWPVRPGPEGVESTTPTGAAIVTALGSPGTMPAMVLERTGTGAGTRDPADQANVVRAVLSAHAQTDRPPAQVLELCAQMDDMSGEHLPPLIQALLDAGAVDAYAQPILMKKGRAGLLVTALSAPDQAAAVEVAMLRHGSTFGVRRKPADRTCLDRWHETVITPWGEVRVKIGALQGEILHAAPEYEDVQRVASAAGQSTIEVHSAALSAWRQTQETP